MSREILQKDARVEAMKSAVTRRALDMLAKLAKDDSEKYQKFWDTFGECLKEGPAEDYKTKSGSQVIAICVYANSTTNRRLGSRITLPGWLRGRRISTPGV